MHLIENINQLKSYYSSDYSDDYGQYSLIEYVYNLDNFYDALMQETSKSILEKCVLDNSNWELPVEATISLLLRARKIGCDSEEFLSQFYGYLQAHLDSGEAETAKIDEICLRLGLLTLNNS